jgi:hypothetical protein
MALVIRNTGHITTGSGRGGGGGSGKDPRKPSGNNNTSYRVERVNELDLINHYK